MRLKNKKTGEIAEFVIHKRIEDSEDGNRVYAPFDLNPEEWEDYEELRGYWCITQWGGIVQRRKMIPIHGEDWEAEHKAIGNYFETKEEAEKAVEKLKAWKRLKDKGFDFVGCFEGNTINYEFVERPLDYDEAEEVEHDLDLLFGGEE